MYSLHKFVLIALALIVAISTWFCGLNVGWQFCGTLLSLVGILFGFTITASVAMKGSGFLSNQSKIVDKSVSGVFKTNAQRLCDYVESSCKSDILLMAVLIIYHFIPNNPLVTRVSSTIILTLVAVVVALSFLMLKTVMHYLREE